MQKSPAEILIAEDSPTQALLLENILEKNGFGVIVARNGRLALEKLGKIRPVLVISDVQMPEMDGYQLCQAIKGDASIAQIPVMLLTSLSAPQDIIRGLECGADNFVVKPYEEEFLMNRVRTIIGNLDLRLTAGEDGGVPIHFAGKRYVINADRRQILNLLLSTYETAVKTNLDLVKTHEELKAAQAQLIEAEKLQSVGRLAAGVAHEVRNPLAILEMGVTFLADQACSEDTQVVLGEMKEAVARANIVITSLMEISSPRELGSADASLNEVIEAALTGLAKEFAGNQITVVKNLAKDLPASRLDRGKIEQVFLNVFTNAVHAMPDGGTLEVQSSVKALGADDVQYLVGDRSGARLREGEKAVVVEVRDTGTGIAAENLGKVFEPFFSTKPTGKGMGLGLTVARKIVDAHHGAISLRNGESGGAVVTLMFKHS